MVRDVDSSLVRAFVAAARARSISRAAAALGRTQPAVSQQLRRLERAVGRPLLRRGPGGVSLTPAGEIYLPYAERLLALNDEAHGRLGGRNARGRRGVGLLEDLAAVALSAALADFGKVHRDVDLEVVMGPTDELIAGMAAGRLHLVVGDASSTAAVPRFRKARPLSWAAAPELDVARDPLHLAMFSPPCRWREPVLRALNEAGRTWRVVFESTSLGAVQAAVRAGLGLSALLPGTFLPGMVSADGHRALPPAPTVDVGLYRLEAAERDPALDRLESLLRRLVA